MPTIYTQRHNYFTELSSQEVWVLQALLHAQYRPRVIAVAYNSHFPPNATISCDLSCPVPARNCRLYGASFGAINVLLERERYHLVNVVSRQDLLYVDKRHLRHAHLPPTAMYYGHFGHAHRKTCVAQFGSEGFRFVHNHVVDFAGKTTPLSVSLSVVIGSCLCLFWANVLWVVVWIHDRVQPHR